MKQNQNPIIKTKKNYSQKNLEKVKIAYQNTFKKVQAFSILNSNICMKKIKKSATSQRSLILSISMFLLNSEEMRNLLWTVKSANYNGSEGTVRIGIDTTTGKLGTTLTRLRKTCKDLSNYLFEQNLTSRPARIVFFVDKKEEKINKIHTLIDKLDAEIMS